MRNHDMISLELLMTDGAFDFDETVPLVEVVRKQNRGWEGITAKRKSVRGCCW
jgi:hypothetical protein